MFRAPVRGAEGRAELQLLASRARHALSSAPLSPLVLPAVVLWSLQAGKEGSRKPGLPLAESVGTWGLLARRVRMEEPEPWFLLSESSAQF